MSGHLENNAADRALGEQWEKKGCDQARWFGKAFTPHQHQKSVAATWENGSYQRPTHRLLADITIYNAPGEHHEIKHKNATHARSRRDRCYGLEEYRLESLLDLQRTTQQDVFLTFHDWELAGARHSDEWMPNVLQDWRIVEVRVLADYLREQRIRPIPMATWLKGEAAKVPGYYWPIHLWSPLHLQWGVPGS